MRLSLLRLLAAAVLTAGGLCVLSASSARAEGKGGIAGGAKAGGQVLQAGAKGAQGGNALAGLNERELVTLLKLLLDDLGRRHHHHHHHAKGNGKNNAVAAGKGNANANGNGNAKGNGNANAKGNGKGNGAALAGKGAAGGQGAGKGGHAAGRVGGRVGLPAGMAKVKK